MQKTIADYKLTSCSSQLGDLLVHSFEHRSTLAGDEVLAGGPPVGVGLGSISVLRDTLSVGNSGSTTKIKAYHTIFIVTEDTTCGSASWRMKAHSSSVNRSRTENTSGRRLKVVSSTPSKVFC